MQGSPLEKVLIYTLTFYHWLNTFFLEQNHMETACTELAENWFLVMISFGYIWEHFLAWNYSWMPSSTQFINMFRRNLDILWQNTAFSAIISDAALGKEYDRANPRSRIEVVKHEVCRNLPHSLLIDLYVCIILSYW